MVDDSIHGYCDFNIHNSHTQRSDLRADSSTCLLESLSPVNDFAASWQTHMLRLLFTLICLEYPHHLRFKFSAAFSYIYDYDICHQTHTFHQMIFYIIFTYLIEWIEKKHELVATRWSPINVHIVMGGVEKLCQSHKLYRIHRQNNK